jgi:hypothetical protein
VDDPGETVDCEGFADAPVDGPVSVVIRNDTGAPLFLGDDDACSYNIELELADADGQPLVWRGDGLCMFTCEHLQQSGAGCPAICPIPPLVYIEPGGSYTDEWTGRYREERVMPESCWLEPDYSGTGRCDQLITAPDGDYRLTARAWTALDNCDADPCLCTPDPSGSCLIDSMGSASVTTSTAREATTTVTYPSQTSVEIVFD